MTSPVAVVRDVSNSKGEFIRRRVMTFCPGCKMAHPFTVENTADDLRGDGSRQPTWDWDGNLEAPTFSPSMLCHGSVHLCEGEHPPAVCQDPDACGESGHLVLHPDLTGVMKGDPPGERVLGHNTPHTRDPAWGNCHSFLRAGRWQFLGDSAHCLAGQTVDMVPLPDWLV